MHDKNLDRPQISNSGHSIHLSTGNIKTQCPITILFPHCSIWSNSKRKCMKNISVSKLMLICVYTDKHVCKYVRMDRWMDARTYVRNFVSIMSSCVCRSVCIYADLCTVFMYIWICEWEYKCIIYVRTHVYMFNMYTWLCTFLHIHLCV
jgi:hypothetical protein